MNPRTRTDTRDRILDAAESLITRHGFTATSVEKILEEVGITKGAYFYHFKSKAEMARALIRRNADMDLGRMDEYAARARELTTDPLEALLVFLGLYVEMFEGVDVDGPIPGCLFVSYSAESTQFDAEVVEVLEHVIVAWRRKIAAWLDEAAAARPPAHDFDRDGLADMLTVVFEGSFVVARMARDPRVFVQQLRHYRRYVELLFKGN